MGGPNGVGPIVGRRGWATGEKEGGGARCWRDLVWRASALRDGLVGLSRVGTRERGGGGTGVIPRGWSPREWASGRLD